MNNNFRIGWAAVSDRVGRWNTFQGLTFLAIPIFALSPFLINNCVLDPTGYYPKGAGTPPPSPVITLKLIIWRGQHPPLPITTLEVTMQRGKYPPLPLILTTP